MAVQQWATFDCYGTLIDWNLGIRRELESAPFNTYREVLTLALERLAQEESIQLPEGEAGALGRSLPDWPPFPEVPSALAELRERGWQLAILSNSDRDLIAASQRLLGVPFDLAIVAEDVESYKPAHRHWERFFEATTADRERHVHVAASLFHDIAPAHELGLRSVWINRLGEPADPEPDRELPDLSGLPDTLGGLVPA